MPLTIACRCGQHYSVDERYAGQRVPCSACGELLLIVAQLQQESPQGPARSGASGALAALAATLLFVLVLGGGVVGAVWWLALEDASDVAVGDSPAEKKEK